MVSLARTDAKLNSVRAAAPDNVQQPLLFFCTKIRPGHLAVSGALKTIYVFYCGKIPAKQVLCSRRSKVSARRPYAPDTRGVCSQGPSRALWYLKPLRKRRGMKSGFSTVLSGTGQNVQPVLCTAKANSTVPHRCIAQ